MNKLRRIADRFNLCVFIVNQVSDDFKDTSSSSNTYFHTMSEKSTDSNALRLESQMPYEAALYSSPDLVEGEDEQAEMLRRYRRQFYLSSLSGKVRKKPALGLAWSCYVNMSLMCSKSERSAMLTFKTTSPNKRRRISQNCDSSFQKEEEEEEVQVSQEAILRQLHVVFAPHVKNGTQSFIVEKTGLKGIDLAG